MSRIGPVLRTLCHLRPSQILWRLWYRARLPWFATEAYRARLRGGSATPVAAPAKHSGNARRGREILGGRITLLSQEHALGERPDWHPAERSPLWRFTLHYFEWLDDLAELGADGRPCARALVSDWLARHRLPDREGWHPYPLSLRLFAWLSHADFLLEGADEPFRSEFVNGLHVQADHLSRVLERDVGGNHLIKNLKALIAAARCLPGHEVAGRNALDLLRAEIGRQILPDGAHYERSPSYHLQVLGDLDDVTRLLPDPPIWLTEATERMRRALAFYRHGDGELALFNDGTLGQESMIASLAAPIPPADLPDAGYHRLSEAGVLVLFDAGRCCPDDLPAHAHADTLSFEMSEGAQRLIVNCGTYAYQDPVWRNRLRGTAQHTTVTIDDLDSAEVYGAFRLGRRPKTIRSVRTANSIEGSHDGYRHLGVMHRRALLLEPGRLAGRDLLDGPGLPGRRATARFHLHPDIHAQTLEDGILLQPGSGPAWIFRSEGGRTSLAESVFCPDFNLMLATRMIVCEAHAASRELSLTWSLTRTD